MDWKAPTYKEAYGLEDNPPVRCACGRTTNADMLVDVRAIPELVRRSWGFRGDFACDACREGAFRAGRVERDAFFLALGAPVAFGVRIRDFAERRRVLPREVPRA
jgi:hypothetical protein